MRRDDDSWWRREYSRNIIARRAGHRREGQIEGKYFLDAHRISLAGVRNDEQDKTARE
jgi:hypothetical protein